MTNDGRTLAEERVEAALREDKTCSLSSEIPAVNSPNSDDLTVRGQVLLDLLTQGAGADPPRPQRLALGGAIIVGLDLSNMNVVGDLIFVSCRFIEGITMDGGTFNRITFINCEIGTLTARFATFLHDLEFTDCRVAEFIDLAHANITGHASLRATRLGIPKTIGVTKDDVNDVLCCEFIRVGGDVNLSPDFTAYGSLSFPSSEIHGNFFARGANIDASVKFLATPGEGRLDESVPYGINLDQSVVRQGLYCDSGFSSAGVIRLIGAEVGGQLSLRNAMLSNGAGPTLVGHGLIVGGDVHLDGVGFMSFGNIELVGARIQGMLHLDGTAHGNSPKVNGIRVQLITPGKVRACVFDLRRSEIGALSTTNISSLISRNSGAKVGMLFPPPGLEELDDVIAWLKNDPDAFAAAPYAWLARQYREGGLDQAAKDVHYAAERERRREREGMQKLWSNLFDSAAGYGYKPWRAVRWLSILFIVGYLSVSVLSADPLLRELPGVPQVSHFVRTSDEGSPFHPLLFTARSIAPLIDLGFSGWAPGTVVAQIVTGVLSLAGWLLLTVLLAGFYGVVRRGE